MTKPTKLTMDEIRALATPEGTPLPGGGMVYSIDPIELAARFSPDGVPQYHDLESCSDPEQTIKFNELVRQWRIDHGMELPLPNPEDAR